MATHQLRRFGNLAFLQSIDKPGVLRKLLEPSGDDLIGSSPGSTAVAIPLGVIVRAVFLIWYASGGRARRLEVRLPNIADYDRARDGVATEAFLCANHLLRSPDTDADGLVDAA